MDIIHEAVKALARQCDGALRQDNVGFNGTDTRFGHSLAAQARLSEKQRCAAVKMLKKYERQLEKLGYKWADIEQGNITHTGSAVSSTNSVQTQKNTRVVRIEGQKIIFAFPYDAEIKDDLKDTFQTAHFDGNARTWDVPINAASVAVAFAEKWGFESSTLIKYLEQKSLADTTALQLREQEIEQRFEKLPDLTQPINGITLRPYQQDGVRFLVRNTHAILADDMGLGKTYTSLIATKAFPNYPVFVVCPASLKDNWLREAASVRVKIEVFSWAKVPEPISQKYIVIVDEAHYAQNGDMRRKIDPVTKEVTWEYKTQRTGKFINLTHNAQVVWLLTGTPVKNGRPKNLFPLLTAIKHPLAKNKKAYEVRYCNAGPTRFTAWDNTGASHLEELHTHIKSHVLRRLKSEVLVDLPEKTRILHPLDIADADRRAYDKKFHELRTEYIKRRMEGTIKADGEALVLLNHLRHAGSLCKVNATVTFAEEIIEQSGCIVIFTEFTDTATQIAQQLSAHGVSLLVGSTPSAQRQGLVDNFQSGATRVFVSTIKSGGVGITLTRASYVLLVDRAWTPGDCLQAEDRVYRIGQQNAVTAYWLQCCEADYKIDGVLHAKLQHINHILGEESTLFDHQALAANLFH